MKIKEEKDKQEVIMKDILVELNDLTLTIKYFEVENNIDLYAEFVTQLSGSIYIYVDKLRKQYFLVEFFGNKVEKVSFCYQNNLNLVEIPIKWYSFLIRRSEKVIKLSCEITDLAKIVELLRKEEEKEQTNKKGENQ